MEKIITINGLPDIVEVKYYGVKNGAYARINLDSYADSLNIDNLIKAMTMLKELGFAYEGKDYSLGYYDSVEDITLEFTNTSFKPQKTTL